MSEPVRIHAEASLVDPDSCTFVVSGASVRLAAQGPLLFGSSAEAAGSPLPARLFSVPGVRTVLLDGDVVSVTKTPEVEWVALRGGVGAAIREILSSAVLPVVHAPVGVDEATTDDAVLAGRVQSLLDREVNPGVGAHGGRVHVVKVEGPVLYVRLSGGCQGCAASSITLRQGVEGVVQRAFPRITRLVDDTDHLAGAAPFYAAPPAR